MRTWRRRSRKICREVSSGSGGFGLEAFCGVVGDEGVDGGLEHAFHDHGELVIGEADAVVGETVLREVVGADFVASDRRNLPAACAPWPGAGGCARPRLRRGGTAERACLFAILDLRLFVLAGDDGVGRKMRDADRRVGGVDRLAAGAGGAEGVDAEILVFDLDVDFFGFGEDGDGDGRGVDAALGFGRGNALYAVDAGLVLHLGVDVLAFDDGGDVLEAAYIGLGFGEDFDLPLVLLGEAEIHAEDFGDEQRSLVAAGAGAEFEDDVFVVVGILGEEEDFSSSSVGVSRARARRVRLAPSHACRGRTR